MFTWRGSRPALWVLTMLAALALTGCDQVADLIPGDSTQTPDASAPDQVDPTPILVTPTLGVTSTRTATAQATIPDHELARSVVEVLPTDDASGRPRVIRDGSGVVVDSEHGLILTSYPVVDPFASDGGPAYSYIAIGANRVAGSPPTTEFRAEIVDADVSLGLALLRVSETADGDPLPAGAFDLPAVRIGDAGGASAGFGLRLFGHPGLERGESQAVRVTEDAVIGLRGDADHDGRTAFKLETALPYGVAGGPAFDASGSLVGVLVQDHYAPTGEVGQVRPIDLAASLIQAAQDGIPGTELRPPLMRSSLIPGSSRPLPQDGVWVSRPAFAENAIEGARSRDLFDYGTTFPAALPTLFYEYVMQGVPAGALVEERWFLDDVQQDSLSSSVSWDGRKFGIVSDRITAPGPAGIPAGRWRLEVWVDDVFRATSTAMIGVPAGDVAIEPAGGGSAATADGTIRSGAFRGADRLLAFFDFTGMEGVRQIQWHVFKDNRRIYISPVVDWHYGDSGRFWIGFEDGAPIEPGLYEFEIHIENRIAQILQVRVN